jgi:broad specificity phosphatase PhoE
MLYLVRHASVDPRPGQPSAIWRLSPQGRAGADALAAEDCWAWLTRVYSSAEPKAIATAQRIAMRNALPLSIEPALGEVERPWVDANYKAEARRYLSGELLEGWETRGAATARIQAAIHRIDASHAEADVAVVSHGLILSLYLSDLLALDDLRTAELWNGIAFPDYAIVDPQGRALVQPFGQWAVDSVRLKRVTKGWPHRFLI